MGEIHPLHVDGNGSAEPVQGLLDGLLDVGLGQERRDIDGACAQPPIRALRQPPLLI